MKEIRFDVMLGDRWQCTLTYRYCPLFPLDIEDIRRFVIEQRPTLRNQQFEIAFI